MLKNKIKYLLSAALCLALFAGISIYAVHMKDMKVNADETEKEEVVSRGVIDNYAQLPKEKRDGTTKAEVGTKKNPFLILEIVPCNEFAEIGYLISGCEPVKVEEMYGRGDLRTVQSASGAKVTQNICYFFPDEEEGNPKNYDSAPGKYWADITLKGYYEKVGENQGYFKQDSDGNIVKSGKNQGDIIWHTVNDFEKGKYEGISFEDDISVLKNKGDRLYTKRKSDKDDADRALITYAYYNFENSDYFLKDSLGLTQEEADKFSIVIKTITPSELKKNSAWIDCSNLIYVNPKTHFGNDLINIWKNDDYRRTSERPTYTGSDYGNKQTFVGNDISWENTEKIYKKVTAETDYAGIIMDVKTHDGANGNKKVKVQVYDQNLQKLQIKNNGEKYKTIESSNASDNNVYKLILMLYSMDSKAFNKLYFDKDNPKIKTITNKNGETEGVDTLQTGDAAKYWCSYTFLLFDTEQKKYWQGNDYYYNWDVYSYWTKDEAWEKYKTHLEFSQYRPWVRDHIYVYNSDSSLPQSYMNQGSATNPNKNKFDGYYESVKEYLDSRFGTDEEIEKALKSSDKEVREAAQKAKNEKANYKETPSNAVRYILGIHSNSNNNEIKLEKDSVKVLDIEPSVGLKQKDSATNVNQVDSDYKLTEDDVRGILTNGVLSKYDGKIEITHMTTAEFIGRTEDLNSTYDMIYMGMDSGAYNKNSNGMTVWNDKSMNGKIYFHTGDKITSSEQKISLKGIKEDRSVKYLWSVIKKAAVNSTELRYPGNDITAIKEKELKDFVKSGRPVVMEESLYNNDTTYVDQYSNISDFIKTDFEADSAYNGNRIYSESDSNGIVKAINSTNSVSVEFSKTPGKYNGDTGTGNNSNKIIHPNYLEKDSDGRAILPFKFTVTYKKAQSDDDSAKSVRYAYKVYIDKNQDSKFTESESVYSSLGKDDSEFEAVALKNGESRIFSNENFKLDKEYVGLISWKIVIYDVDNSSVRFVKTGCSAAAKSSASDKKKVNVLQIMPDPEKAKANRVTDGMLDLSTSAIFKKYYQNIEDYKITVDTMTVEEFEQIFKEYHDKKGNDFEFDNSKEISFDTGKQNPKNYNLTDENNVIRNKLKDYNMLIFGFGDMYCLEDISNEHGAVDFIKYFIAQKKSVLFTHDITSLNDVGEGIYGYTANALLRDVMGMNRYKAVGNPAKTAMTENDKNILINYQKERAYDTVKDIAGNTLDALHGYTYVALRRLGYNGAYDEKVPYRYMITGVDGNPVYKDNNNSNNRNSKNCGFSNDNDCTTKISKVNDGQITSYPYHIDKDKFNVATTHSQYYQLNMEDPEVTVWYTLDDDGKNNNRGYTTQSAHAYGVSPNDTANNYYIYSKGNVFYSSVGHSTVTNDMEAKLFVNTMIAAYRASYQSPYVEVQNAEQIDENSRIYQITSEEEYGKKSDGTIRVYFRPTDENLTGSKFTCSIYYPATDGTESGDTDSYITGDKIYRKDTGKSVSESVSKSYTLSRDHIYYFDYPKKYLSDASRCKIIFKLMSKEVKEPGYTTLNMIKKQMFELD